MPRVESDDDVAVNGPLEVGAEYDNFEALELRVIAWVAERTPHFRVETSERTHRKADARSNVKHRMYEADERTEAMVAADLSTATLRCTMHALSGCPFLVYATQSAPGAEWIVEQFHKSHSKHAPPAGRPSRGAARGKRAASMAAELSGSSSSSSSEAEASDDGDFDASDAEPAPSKRRRRNSSDIELLAPPKRPVAGSSKPRASSSSQRKTSAPVQRPAPITLSPSPPVGPPGMPSIGSHWPTLSAFEGACRGAAKQSRPAFRVMGGKDPSKGLVRCEFFRAGCPFRILAPKNGLMNAFIVAEATYDHAHHGGSAPVPRPAARAPVMTPESEPRQSPVRPAIDDPDSLGSESSDGAPQPSRPSATPAPTPLPPLDLSAPLGPFLASLHPSLAHLGPALVAGGLEDRVGELLNLDRDGIFEGFLKSLEGIKPLERVRLLHRIAEERAAHFVQLATA